VTPAILAVNEQDTGNSTLRMTIVFHLGLHCTDGGLLIRSILQNRDRLAGEGIEVPGPARYRDLIGSISTKLRGAPAPPETEAMILDTIAEDLFAERIVLSNENFLCRSDVALGIDCLYPKAGKSAWLRNCVPSREVEFALALRNPASFLPDLLSGKSGPCPPDALLRKGVWLDDLRWEGVIERIRAANPDSRIVVWCHEDTPFIWSEIIHDLTGHDPYLPLDGAFDMAETIMTPDGFTRLTEFVAARDVNDEIKRRRAMSAFLEAHARPEAIEAEIDLPGWTEDTVNALTDLYEDDVAQIASLPGVTFISP
jgi:hypothetical protein